VYPENGQVEGIGPYADTRIPIQEIDYETGTLNMNFRDDTYRATYSEGSIEVFRL